MPTFFILLIIRRKQFTSKSFDTLIPPDDAVYIKTVIVFLVASLKVTSKSTFPLIGGSKSRVLSQFGVRCKKNYNIKQMKNTQK